MSAPFVALIVPLDNVSGGSPPGIWGGGNVPMPTPPIYLPPQGGGGGPQLPTWGGGPGARPPIYNPEPQPPGGGGGGGGGGIWGPGGPWPQPPINLPPGYPGAPPGTWGGAGQPFPTPPIYLPPDAPEGPVGPPIIGSGPQGPQAFVVWYNPKYGFKVIPLPEAGKPPGTWGGAGEPLPTPPMVVPPTTAEPKK